MGSPETCKAQVSPSAVSPVRAISMLRRISPPRRRPSTRYDATATALSPLSSTPSAQAKVVRLRLDTLGAVSGEAAQAHGQPREHVLLASDALRDLVRPEAMPTVKHFAENQMLPSEDGERARGADEEEDHQLVLGRLLGGLPSENLPRHHAWDGHQPHDAHRVQRGSQGCPHRS
eukprot:scaffold682_cov231-Pinguiococcus_pyrenoidosus.AAC.5